MPVGLITQSSFYLDQEPSLLKKVCFVVNKNSRVEIEKRGSNETIIKSGIKYKANVSAVNSGGKG